MVSNILALAKVYCSDFSLVLNIQLQEKLNCLFIWQQQVVVFYV